MEFKSIRVVFVVIILLVSYNICSAGWTDPIEIVSGSWGIESGQFSIKYQDTYDIFPTNFAISSIGQIAISEDQTVKRVQLFNNGTFATLIDTFAFDLVFNTHNDLFVTGAGLRKYDYRGSLIWSKPNVSLVSLYSINDGNIIGYNRVEKKYHLYSPTGELLKTTTERPLELGWVKKRRLGREGKGRHTVTVRYPDKVWGLILKKASPMYRYIKDMDETLYGVGSRQVVRYNDCGIETAKLVMPETQYQAITLPPEWPENAEPPRVGVQKEYGSPVIAPNGDVYTWKRTPDTYNILKWTWQDDPKPPADVPDVPVNLAISPSTTALNLTWKPSLQDPGCVTGYEIARSTVPGGSYSAIGTVINGFFSYSDTSAETGTTYYYRVRAIGGDGYSEYSNTVSGQR